MGRRKREPMNLAKKNIVSKLIKTYDPKLQFYVAHKDWSRML